MFVATSQAERTVQALHQSVEVAERRAVEVEERANTQVQEVKHALLSQTVLCKNSCVKIHCLPLLTVATGVVLWLLYMVC